MKQIKLLCLNDSNKPEEIPTTHWVKKDEWYTLKNVASLSLQNGLIGVQFDEIDLVKLGGQHEYFALDRFGIDQKDIPAFNEVVITSGEISRMSTEKMNEWINKI